MRLDFPPGGFLLPPAAAPPDGAGGCVSCCWFGCSGSSCSASASSGLSLTWPFSCCLCLHTMAAPELWMVVSSGCGFLGNRIGCWHRLRGAEGSPHRVPVAGPLGSSVFRLACGSSGSAKILETILFFFGVVFSSEPKERLVSPPGGLNTLELLLAPGSMPWKVVVVVIAAGKSQRLRG